MKFKIYHTLPWWLNTAVKCTRVADYHPKIPCITAGAEYHCSMYQSPRLPSKKKKNTVDYATVVSEYRGKCYQPQKSLPRRALEILENHYRPMSEVEVKVWKKASPP